jgi:hypothetical protein
MELNKVFYDNMNAIRNRYDNQETFLDVSDALTEYALNNDGNSQMLYPDNQMAMAWADNFKEQVINRTYYLIGFSDGKFITCLLRNLNDTNSVYIYEPDISSFINVLNTYNLTECLSDKRMAICVEGINGDGFFDVIVSTVTYDNCRLLMAGVLPGYEKYTKEYEDMCKMISYRIETVQFDMITEMQLCHQMVTNKMGNMCDIIKQRSINQLIDKFNELNKNGGTAIIVSAGPSLDKNVEDLKKAEGKAMIIAVDTALKTVLRAGVRPDLTICVDPRKEIEFFGHEQFKDVPAVFEMEIPSAIIDMHSGSRFYAGSGEEDIPNHYRKLYFGEGYKTIAGGGSVANSAFSLAMELGFKTIILVGQDLAFTDGKGHTKGAYDNEEKNVKDATQAEYVCEVESIDGGTVKTETRMRSYLRWFENSIAAHKEIKVIDATEGGALIHGSKVMKLSEVIQSECSMNAIDYREVINSIPQQFDDDMQKEIFGYLADINTAIDELEAEINGGIKAYNDLAGAIRVGNTSLVSEIMKKVRAVNELEEKEPLFSLIKRYAVEDRYNVKEDLYQSETDDTMAAINGGIKLLKSYINGMEIMKTETHLCTDKIN